MRIIPIVFLVVFIGCSESEEVLEPVPEYMFEVFSSNQPCDTINYFMLDFGDPTFFRSDTMPEVRLGDRFDPNVIGAGLAKTFYE